MCNLYNITTNQQAIRAIIGMLSDNVGNLEPSIDAFPDRPAPVVRNTADGKRELTTLIWGMPTPNEHLKPGAPDTGVTNIRKPWVSHWRRWTGVPNRCVVPVTAFCEYAQAPDPVTKKKPKVWFALDQSQPLFFFAGLWTTWTGVRGSMKTPRSGDHELFAFLTCDPNGVVAPVHPKAMPVILTDKDEIETWLTADWKEAKMLQRPLPDVTLQIVEREDAPVQGTLFG
jgi:putative SOS response-associated peptidase YedK